MQSSDLMETFKYNHIAIMMGVPRFYELLYKGTKSKIDIEDLKFEINRSFSYASNNDQNILDTASLNVVPIMVKRISNDLDSISKAIIKSNLSEFSKEELLTKVRKNQVQMDNLRIKTTEFLSTLFLGLILMIFGFILWYKKDQVVKDKILLFELKKSITESSEIINTKDKK